MTEQSTLISTIKCIKENMNSCNFNSVMKHKRRRKLGQFSTVQRFQLDTEKNSILSSPSYESQLLQKGCSDTPRSINTISSSMRVIRRSNFIIMSAVLIQFLHFCTMNTHSFQMNHPRSYYVQNQRRHLIQDQVVSTQLPFHLQPKVALFQSIFNQNHKEDDTRVNNAQANKLEKDEINRDVDEEEENENESDSQSHKALMDSPTAPEVKTWTKIMTNPHPFSNPTQSTNVEDEGSSKLDPESEEYTTGNMSNSDSYLSTLTNSSSQYGYDVNNGIHVNGDSSSAATVSSNVNYANGIQQQPSSSLNTSSSSSSATSTTQTTTTDNTVPKLNLDVSLLSQSDLDQIETYWDKLMPHVSYLGTTNSFLIKEALRVAYTSHRHQRRKSGEPFIIHPIEVAILLSSLFMDAETIMAGLLHDTVEDTDLTFYQIEEKFGHTVKSIVEGETKVSKLPRLEFQNYADEQAENLRQMFVAMTDDYRIIIVKLADRLHNMRTLEHMKPAKQLKISKETLDIFAPLAHRMGIWQFKSELEDISFKYLYPTEYRKLKRKLRKHATKLNQTLDYSQDTVKNTLNSDGVLREQAVNVNVFGRTKELYSLYHKMQTKGEDDLDHITDVVALRVIIEPKKPLRQTIKGGSMSDDNDNYDDGEDSNEADWGVWLCYHVLGLVQHLPGFQPVPTKVRFSSIHVVAQ